VKNQNATASGVAVKTKLKAGKLAANENPTAASGVAVKTKLKAGKLAANENSTAARAER
jgi:hypothetical protein